MIKVPLKVPEPPTLHWIALPPSEVAVLLINVPFTLPETPKQKIAPPSLFTLLLIKVPVNLPEIVSLMHIAPPKLSALLLIKVPFKLQENFFPEPIAAPL